jgi:hypothetical protein
VSNHGSATCSSGVASASAVGASSKTDAIALLDEVGNAEVCELFTAEKFMAHFSLKQETDEVDSFVPVELEGFGEETVDTLSARVYPANFNAAIAARRISVKVVHRSQSVWPGGPNWRDKDWRTLKSSSNRTTLSVALAS